MNKLIRGAGAGGKGGGKAYKPKTSPDGLDSTQYAQLIDLISEGEIQGLKDGLKSIYINNTPLQNADNSLNFQDVEVYTQNGTQNQPAIPLASTVENEVNVSVALLSGLPIVRSITDPNVDAARITVSVPQLQKFTSKGDIVGTSIRLQIAVQYAGGGFTTVIDDTIVGRTADLYQRDYLVNFTGASPVDIKMTRITSDSLDPKIVNAFSWASYTEIVNARLRYPNSALIGMRVDAEQFSSIPQRAYLVRGIKVQIPSNATVDSATGRLIYSGPWYGTFSAAQWCSDPAWILWDLLTSTRYGFGDHIQAAQLDKWSFYSASQYASALVPNGFGGQEPRFSCNVNIQTQEDAYKLVNDMCSVFRAMPYWSAGALAISQDAPADPTYLFTLANVTEEGFVYRSSGQKTRPTVAVVSYLDLNTRELAYETVEDQAAIAKYGVVVTQISAFACTSRGQASRMGDWLLYSEQYEGEVISFSASLDAGVMVRPGQIIQVADPVRAGSRRGGRIVSATATTITVDDATDLTPGTTPQLSVILPDGTAQTQTVGNITGNVVTVDFAFSQVPNANSVWIYQTNDLLTSTWRVLGVQEQDGSTYLINALAYNASKYSYIERDAKLQFRDTSNLNDLPAAPTSFAATEALYTNQSEVRAKVVISWKPVSGVNQYQVRWRKDSGNWATSDRFGPDYEILNITPGLFEFQIYSVNAALKFSAAPLTGSINALGKTAPPSTVSNFGYVLDASLGVTLTWNPITDIDLADYEIRRGSEWNSGTVVTRVKASSYKIGYLDDGTYTYFIRARDTSGVYSETPVSTSITVAPPGQPTVTHEVLGEIAIIDWTVTTGSYLPSYYEVRYGGSFGGGISLGQFKTTSINVPITWTGSRTFWVAAVDPVGNIGAAGFTVVQNTSAPAPSINHEFGADSVRLFWNEVNGVTRTKMYEIRRGGTFSTATVISTIQATSFSVKVNWVGAESFWVVPIDSNNNLGTPGSRSVTVLAAGAPTVNDVFSGEQVILSWQALKGSIDTAFYQVRRGTTFATAPVIGTIQGTTYAVKVDWSQTQRFWVAAVDVAGNVGAGDSSDIIVSAPTQPSITSQVVDNNVLLRWNDTTTVLPIVYYELRRGSTWATATVIGTKQGRFTSVFETVAGNFTYWLAGVDSGGNVGTPGAVTATVSQPPDYVLQLNQNSTFSGTKTNVFVEGGNLFITVNTTETWESHFTSRGWTTIQDQINAGFSIYALPSTTTGFYEETIDYGAVLPSSKITATLTSQTVIGSITITPRISVRKLITDPWIDYNNVTEVYVTDFRYIKIRYDFASSGGDDLSVISALNVRLDVKNRNDGGSGTANAGDTGGTVTTFNVPFTDVQSISVTPSGTAPRVAVYDFVDIPNPTSFKVLLFDTSGNRVTGNYSWIAKGV